MWKLSLVLFIILGIMVSGCASTPLTAEQRAERALRAQRIGEAFSGLAQSLPTRSKTINCVSRPNLLGTQINTSCQ